MYPALGNQWTMLYNLTSTTFSPPRALDTSCSSAVLDGLEYEVGLLDPSQAPVPGDFYYWGGTLAAQARLALIAYDVSLPDMKGICANSVPIQR
jgi:endo-1,3(4)-beta-glucanase